MTWSSVTCQFYYPFYLNSFVTDILDAWPWVFLPIEVMSREVRISEMVSGSTYKIILGF